MLALFAAVAVVPQARAQEAGPYVGAALGQSKFKEWCSTGGDPNASFNSCKDTDTAWKLFGGYRFNRYLAAEASYIDWGEVTANVTVGGTPREVAATQRSYGLAGVGSFDLGHGFTIFGRLGFLKNEQETRRVSPNPSTLTRDDTGIHYGVGGRYLITPNWALRGEWENTEKLEVQLVSLGAEYRF